MRWPAGVSLGGFGLAGGAGSGSAPDSAAGGGAGVRWQAVPARQAHSSSAAIGRQVMRTPEAARTLAPGSGGDNRGAHAAATRPAYDRVTHRPRRDRGRCPARAPRPAWPCATAPLPQHRPRGDGMDKTSNLPLALWQANLDLQMRLGQLLQDGGRQWLEQGTRTAGEGAAEFDAQARKLLQAGDWPALAALPMETFWRQAGQAGDGKAAAQTAL